MKQAIAYLRVSTDKQLDGYGMDLQLQRIRDYAPSRGYRISKIYRESQSGRGHDSIGDRPRLQAAIARSKDTGQPIFVSRVDRLGRHEESVSELYRDGIIIDTDNGPDADQALIDVQARDAERLGNIISRTTKAALKRMKGLGLLGNKKNLSEAQQKGAQANQLRARGRAEEFAPIIRSIDPDRKKTKNQIADALNERGLRTDRGRLWNPGNIRRVLNDVEKIEGQFIAEEDSSDELSFEERQKIDPLFGIF